MIRSQTLVIGGDEHSISSRSVMGQMQLESGTWVELSARYGLGAEGMRAMPSARALLVASLLTEPPYGCLGPPGNDRYRKRSLRSQTVGASHVDCQVAAPQAPRVCWLKGWALRASDSRPTYGKIKEVPPLVRQAIGMACLLAGASVGARAARSRKNNDSNMDFGTHALPLFKRADK